MDKLTSAELDMVMDLTWETEELAALLWKMYQDFLERDAEAADLNDRSPVHMTFGDWLKQYK